MWLSDNIIPLLMRRVKTKIETPSQRILPRKTSYSQHPDPKTLEALNPKDWPHSLHVVKPENLLKIP